MLRPVHVLAATFVVVAGIQSFGQTKPDLIARIRLLNQELLQLSARPPQSVLDRVRTITRLRIEAFQALALIDPSRALAMTLGEPARARLRGFATDIANNVESESDLTGPALVVVEDDFEHHSSQIHFSMQSDSGWLQVYAVGGPGGIRSGTIVRAQGVSLGPLVLARSFSVVAHASPGGCSGTGLQKLAVVMVNFASSSIDPSTVNATTLQSIISGSGHSLTAYWKEASYGQTSASGNIFGPYNLGHDYTGSDYTAIQTAAINVAATTGGVNFSNYTHVVIVMPNGFPVGGGLGTIGCESLTSPTTGTFTAGVIWLRADFTVPNDVGVCAFAHEDGHNLGLNHASTESYGSVPLGSFGTVPVHNEYGSYFSLMSECFTNNSTTLLGHYDAQHKISLGWFEPSNYQTVTSSGSFVLAPTEVNTAALHAIRVERGLGNNFWLWLEYRENLGYDSTFSAFNSQIYSGVMIHFEDPANQAYIGYTRLLNYTAPLNPDFSEPALAVGSTWSDPYSLLTLNVTGADSSGLHVTVNYDTSCATLSPMSRSYSSAGAVSNDSVAVTASGPCSWTGVSNASWITITGGSSGNGSGILTYALSANTGPSPRTGTITIARQQFTITQASSNPQPLPVLVTPDNSGSGANVIENFNFVYSDGNGASALSGVSALFNSSTGTANACHISWLKTDNTVHLDDDASDGGYSYWYANQAGSISNSQCEVDWTNAISTVANSLTLSVRVTFFNSFSGVKNIYMEAQDSLGADSGLVEEGTWAVGVPALSIAKNHSGNFVQGQVGATYTITVANEGAASTSGTVSVTDTVPSGLALVSMSGSGWTCPGTSSNNCTRTDTLAPGQAYSAITVTMNVAFDAPAQVTNQAAVSGGGSASANAQDVTNIVTMGDAVSRTFVSTMGSDANTSMSCSVAANCRTLAAALAVTEPGGEIVIVESGGYGPVIITQPVFISAVGVDATITTATTSASAVTINTNGNVTLRGLGLHGQGAGQDGILVEQAASLRLYDMLVENFSGDGIHFAAAGNLAVYDSEFNDNGHDGILIANASANASINGSGFDHNLNAGLEISAGQASVVDSSVENNQNGFLADGGTLALANDSAIFNTTGLVSSGGGAVYFARCLLSSNAIAYNVASGSTMSGTNPGSTLITPGQAITGTVSPPIVSH